MELVEEAHQIPPPLASKEADLIESTVASLFSIIKITLGVIFCRTAFAMIAFYFNNVFITSEKDGKSAEVWNSIFYLMGILMDFLGLINETTTFKFLKK